MKFSMVAPESFERWGHRLLAVVNSQKVSTKFLSFVDCVSKAVRNIDADVYLSHDPEVLKYAGKTKTGKVVIFISHEGCTSADLDKPWPKFSSISKSYSRLGTESM